MEDVGSSNLSNKAESNLKEEKNETGSQNNVGNKLIILPNTGIALRKLPPIISDRDVRLPCKTPTSPLVQVRSMPVL